MRQFHALALAVLLTVFLIALALVFADLSHQGRELVPNGHEQATG